MKKILLFLAAILSVQSFAQTVTETAMFDFANPRTLTPPTYVANETITDLVSITNYRYTSGEVALTFSSGYAQGAELNYEYTDHLGTGLYRLNIMTEASMTLRVSTGCTITRVTINADSFGDLNISKPSNKQGLWVGSSQSVTFKNGTAHTRISSIIVEYTRPATPLTIQSTSPTNGGTVESFSSLSFSFDANATIVNPDGVTVSGPGLSSSRTATLSVSGRTATASLGETIATDGTYTVSIAAGTFANSEGAKNEAKTYTFKVYAKRTTLTYASASPASGAKLEELGSITLNFADIVKVDASKSATLLLGSVNKAPLTLTVGSDNKSVVLSSEYAPFREKGTYTVNVPASAIHNAFYGTNAEYDRWNDSFTLTYTVERAESATMQAARALLKTGIGYPATTSDAYKNLKAAIDADASDDELQPLMAAYYAASDVTLLSSGSYYKISAPAVSAARGAARVAASTSWYTYKDGVLSTTTSASQAYAFLATRVSDGVFTFATSDATPKYFTTTGLSDSPVNVTLSHFDDGSTVGLLTLTDANGTLKAVAIESGTKPTTPTDVSNQVAPEAVLNVYTLAKAGDALTLIIQDNNSYITAVKLKEEGSTPQFKQNGVVVSYAKTILTKLTNPLTFSVNTEDLPAGDYQLVVPVGTFDYTVATGKTVVDRQFALTFTVKNGSSGTGTTDPDPDPTPNTVTPTISLSPTTVAAVGDNVTLTFAGVEKATLVNANGPYLTYTNSSGATQTVSLSGKLTKSSSSDIVYTLSTAGLTAGTTYTLVIPANAFSYSRTGYTVNNVQRTATFSIKAASTNPDNPTPDDPSPGTTLPQTYSFNSVNVLQKQAGVRGEIIGSEDLNDLVLYAYGGNTEGGIFADPSKKVIITQAGRIAELGYGHFENYTNFSKDPNYVSGATAIKFVPDKAIKDDQFKNNPGLYGYYIPAGTFGDVNFSKYLKNSSSVSASSCKVNAEIGSARLAFYVDDNLHDTKYISEAVLAKARTLVATTGPGYPAVDNGARVVLSQYASSGQGTDEECLNAMESLFAITDVDMPANNTFYNIEAVGSDGSSAWLVYDGTAFSLTKDESRASSLKCTANNSGTYRLSTGDDKYLVTLTSLSTVYDDATCAQAFAKFPKLNSATNEAVYGLLSMRSAAGYALADLSTLTVGESVALLNTFSKTKTSAFRLTAVSSTDVNLPQVNANLSPVAGSQVSLLEKVTVNFSGVDRISLGDLNLIKLTAPGNTEIPVTSVTATIGKTTEFVITFSSVPSGHVYTLEVGEGAFTYYYADNIRKVPAFTATYTVRETAVSDEQLEEARQLLAQKGIGYPTTNSAGRKALQAIVDNGGSDADFIKAREAYYNETIVSKPAPGEWYRIVAVASDNSGGWLQYDGSRIVVTRDAQKAASFKTTFTTEGTYLFTTVDGKYLRLMAPVTSGVTNLTSTLDESVNSLTIEKLPVEGTIGLLAISGNLGGSNAATAQVDVPNSVFTTAVGQDVVYTETLTNAFRFIESSASDITEPVPDTEYSPASSVLEELTKVTVSFTTSNVQLADLSLISLFDGATTYAPTAVTPVSGTTSSYEITFPTLPYDKTYTLTIGRGAFSFVYDGKTLAISSSSAVYTVLPERASNVQLTTARGLLSNVGVGYPAANSTARQQLQSFVDSERPTVDAYVAAVAAFYAETNVELPATDQYYRMAAVTSDGIEAWVKYDGDRLSLTKVAKEATGFQATVHGNAITLTTGDHKYFAALNELSSPYDLSVNELTIAHFAGTGIDPQRALGLLSIHGGRGYALADVSTLTCESSTESIASFTTERTNAFRLVLTTREEIPAPEVAYSFSPTAGTKLDVLENVTVTFDDKAAVTLADTDKVTLTDSDDQTYTPTGVAPVEGWPNAFCVTFADNLPVGKVYTLTFGKGTFTFEFADSTYVMNEITATYSVREPEATADQLKEAAKLLNKRGLGCPSQWSAARQALQRLFDEGGTISEFAAAIEAYKHDTDIEKPTNNHYYYISAVGNTGRQLYLHVEGSGVTLTPNQTEATPFRTEMREDGTTDCVTVEGKYLRQLKASSVSNGVTDSYDYAANALTLGRLLIEGKPVEDTMGYFSLCDVDGVYALVDVKESMVMTNARFGLSYFDDDFTNAFVFTDASNDPVSVKGVRTLTTADDAVFDLQGRRVDATQMRKGTIYIRGGKKVVVE